MTELLWCWRRLLRVPWTARKLGEFLFQCQIFLPFLAVHGVLKARILKWFAIPFSSGPCFVRTLHHDPSNLGGPTALSASPISSSLWTPNPVISRGLARVTWPVCTSAWLPSGSSQQPCCDRPQNSHQAENSLTWSQGPSPAQVRPGARGKLKDV